MSWAVLTAAEIDAALAQLEGWSRDGNRLRRRFQFPDFAAAFAWMTGVALVAEKLDHHPDWTNVYGRVDVALTTHDAGGITARDVELAAAMNRLAGSRGIGSG
jgi:4a-hydroxytetrahydrobiopterin dehydratase